MSDALRATEFEAALERAGVDAQLRLPIARYGAIVLEANQRFNLTGAKTPDDFATHIVDSLTLLPYVREPFVDVGSGAGLPAIPIAIAIGIPVTMIEATRKRRSFSNRFSPRSRSPARSCRNEPNRPLTTHAGASILPAAPRVPLPWRPSSPSYSCPSSHPAA